MFGLHNHRHHHHFGPHGREAMRGRGGRGPFFGAWEGGEDRDGGRGRRRVFSGDELRLVLLSLIAQAPRHGYDLIREIEERSAGGYAPSPGVVYPSLTMLSDMDLIAEQVTEGAKKLFAVTEAGSAHLAERQTEVEGLFARLAAMGEHNRREHRGPIRRAMGNLKQALMHRMGEGDLDEEAMHQIAAILDEAVQKIERL